jgi:hypothetical protein
MKIIREKSLEKLKNYIFKSLNNNEIPFEYNSKEVWIDNFFENEIWEREVDKRIYDLSDTIRLNYGDSKKDIDNIKIIHGALKSFSPRILVDEKIWVYLTHKTFYNYMISRWDPVSTSIKDRYFLSGSSTRSLSRNGISRLWFLGHISFDENLSNPYEITEMMMSMQDIMTTIVERPSTAMNKIFFKAIIKLVFQNSLTRDDYRNLLKRCERISGISRFDSFDEEEMGHFLSKMI